VLPVEHLAFAPCISEPSFRIVQERNKVDKRYGAITLVMRRKEEVALMNLFGILR
jgi:hypothetical protein